MEDGCAVALEEKFLAIGGYWETKQVFFQQPHYYTVLRHLTNLDAQVVEYDLFSGSWIQWPELPYGRYHFLHSMSSQRMLMSPTNLHRYGHKCARLGDTVVIAGGADERGDYVPSTMVLDLVTKQV